MYAHNRVLITKELLTEVKSLDVDQFGLWMSRVLDSVCKISLDAKSSGANSIEIKVDPFDSNGATAAVRIRDEAEGGLLPDRVVLVLDGVCVGLSTDYALSLRDDKIDRDVSDEFKQEVRSAIKKWEYEHPGQHVSYHKTIFMYKNAYMESKADRACMDCEHLGELRGKNNSSERCLSCCLDNEKPNFEIKQRYVRMFEPNKANLPHPIVVRDTESDMSLRDAPDKITDEKDKA